MHLEAGLGRPDGRFLKGTLLSAGEKLLSRTGTGGIQFSYGGGGHLRSFARADARGAVRPS